MSLVPLARLVRRARSLAQADTDLLQATFEGIPREELRRLVAFGQDILEEDRHSDSSEATVLTTCQAADSGAHEPVDTDLLGLGSAASSLEPSPAAGPPGGADDGGLASASAPCSGVQSASVPADLDDHESDDGEVKLLPPWEWSESSSVVESAPPAADLDPAAAGAEPSLLAGAQELDLNAMDDDAVPPGRPPARAPTVSAPPDLSAPVHADAPATGLEHDVPAATDSTEGLSSAVAAASEALPGGAGGQDGGTGGADSSVPAETAAAQPALPVVQAAAEPPPTCRLELSGSAELPYLCAVDVLQGLEVPSHVLPLRRPLQRLPRVLREHGHSLSGYCAAPCRARCGFCCGRPVSNTSRCSVIGWGLSFLGSRLTLGGCVAPPRYIGGGRGLSSLSLVFTHCCDLEDSPLGPLCVVISF
ncbi:hypothetical protein AK812_SmicGene1356 [Symbiodinium microadriaticum]|uniref:Uncharacterized protein n=1 Tax=Symbiodinium microadriaticum TaxID=2951 RepID=A0A1Q9F4B1_SYMMI|nr:hypothetical protein AK812_SmicGene1356 [Symbiodinium microadriaticum]CAE7939908.1 unnamed protein product [Symbiodinium sp. KB8]